MGSLTNHLTQEISSFTISNQRVHKRQSTDKPPNLSTPVYSCFMPWD